MRVILAPQKSQSTKANKNPHHKKNTNPGTWVTFSLVGKTDVTPRKTPENQQTRKTVRNVTKNELVLPKNKNQKI